MTPELLAGRTAQGALCYAREHERKSQSKKKGKKFHADVLNLSSKGDIQVEVSNVYWDNGSGPKRKVWAGNLWEPLDSQ